MARDDKAIVGYIVFRRIMLQGLEMGMILDLLVERSETGRWAGNRLLVEETDSLTRAGAHVCVCRMLWYTDEYRIFRDQSYLRCPRSVDPHPFTIIARILADAISPDLLFRLENWLFTLGDWGIEAFSA